MTNQSILNTLSDNEAARYGVYILYQKELHNCDHIYLQSMMDWIYLGNDSPYKFKNRNQAVLYLNNSGVTLSNENTISWDTITFKLKHLKEIYVDKRNKDTCVLVSKISVSSLPNYVWKKANQTNFSQFKPSLTELKANKKNYLVTVIKFKEGHSKLLQSIQYLDKILNGLNSNSPDSVTSASSENNSNIRTSSSTSFGRQQQHVNNNIYDERNLPKKYRSNAQAYFTEISRNQVNTPPEKRPSIYQTYAHIRTNLISSSPTATYATMTNKSPVQIKNDSMTLPRPLSTSSIRDIRSYTPQSTHSDYFTHSPQQTMLNSRHSLTPTSFSNMYNMANMQQQQSQYGVFSMRRSASRTSYTQMPQINNSSFDNTSEIGYTQYAKTHLMNQGDQAQNNNKSSQPLQTPYFMMKTVQQQPMNTQMNTPNPNQSRTLMRSSRDQRPISMVNVVNPSMNLRSSSVNDRMSFARARNESVELPRKAKHEYFTNDMNKRIYTDHKPFVPNTIKENNEASNIKNSIIDENLDLIKAEFDSLKLKKEEEENKMTLTKPTKTTKHITTTERSNRRSSTSGYPTEMSSSSSHKRSSTPGHTLRTKHESLSENKPSPTPSFLTNESSRLKEIIDSFNSFEKNHHLKEHKDNRHLKNDLINEPAKKNIAKEINAVTTPGSPSKTKGLIQYFSNNSKSQLDESQVNFTKQRKDSTTSKTSQTKVKPVSPVPRKVSPLTLVSGQTSPYTVGNQSESRYDTYDTQKNANVENIFNQIFNNKPQQTTTTEPPVKSEDNSHLTMSVDSLEASQHSQTADALNNSLYNNHDSTKKETVYDLATYGIDNSVVQGELEPIFKPIVLQKRSKNQMGRKRTFANMIWPMSAEEEMILRSNSPFVVPEVISTRTDQKRGILKRTQSEVEASDAMVGNYVHSPITTRKRVDFHENYLFVSFFDVPEPEPEPELINYNTVVA